MIPESGPVSNVVEEKQSEGSSSSKGSDPKTTVLREGFLYKKKTKGFKMLRPAWQLRYFVADGKAKTLTYMASEDDGRIKGRLSFTEMVKVARSTGNSTEFQIEMCSTASNGNGSRVFFLRAEDPRDADAWMDVLSKQVPKMRVDTKSVGKGSGNTEEDGVGMSGMSGTSTVRTPGGSAVTSPKVHSPPAVGDKLMGARKQYRSIRRLEIKGQADAASRLEALTAAAEGKKTTTTAKIGKSTRRFGRRAMNRNTRAGAASANSSNTNTTGRQLGGSVVHEDMGCGVCFTIARYIGPLFSGGMRERQRQRSRSGSRAQVPLPSWRQQQQQHEYDQRRHIQRERQVELPDRVMSI